MSVVDWTDFPYPWDNIGNEFSEMLPALVRGDPVPQPHESARSRSHRPRSQARGTWIIERRMAMGLSQRELARRSSCSQAQISRYERGEQQPSQSRRERLSAILLPEAEP
jgi:DNA-binding transcriptional regulator YiaG